MSEHTATVEVLTAEVRVLMVGHRQVTLSVFRQLDRVYPPAIEAFGRVRDPKADHDARVHVVGKCVTDGSLVASECRKGSDWRPTRSEYDDCWGAVPGMPSFDEYVAEEASCDLFFNAWSLLPHIVLAGLT